MSLLVPLGVCVVYLQAQYRARKLRAEQDEYTWPTIGVQFRSKVSKMLKMCLMTNQTQWRTSKPWC
jgi:hypothetical protein